VEQEQILVQIIQVHQTVEHMLVEEVVAHHRLVRLVDLVE
jgi:hypothetical protein